jgi:hypothetical protein
VSYDQTYKGKFVYADAHCLEAGIDAFCAARIESEKHDEGSVVDLGDLEISGLTIAVDMDCSAPASMSFGTQSALRGLGSTAKSGGIDTTFVLDGTSRDYVGNGGVTSSADLPARHRGWEVFFAAKANDAKALTELVASGVDVKRTYQGYRSYTALHIAAEAGAAAAVRVLLDAGIPADVTSPSGVTPLLIAKTGAVAKALLAAGADKDKGSEQFTPIEYAFHWDHLDVVVALLDAGATVREQAHERIVKTCANNGWIDVLHRLVKENPSITKIFANDDVRENERWFVSTPWATTSRR